eukprot:TRINITY_DN12462_c0_g2_i1.p1 TRINITY_DN12462_c0_g2~~TRINITY_DN12462_c0_g2_i1.p1  ORF type:complete len:501 (+),score=159.91 TRINITY_DN12462_c0_g2_i1:99-1505(+)
MVVGDTTTPQPTGYEDPSRNPILEQAATIRQAKISWDAYKEGLLVEEEDARTIQQFDRASAEAKAQHLRDDGVKYLRILLSLFVKVNSIETLRYIVTMLDDLVAENDQALELIVAAANELDASTPVWAHFTKPLTRQDDGYLCHQCARMFVRFVLAEQSVDADAIKTFLDWVNDQLTTSDRFSVLLTLTSLSRALRRDPFREAFIKHTKLPSTFKGMIQPDANIQLLYQTLLCLWVLTFNEDIVAALGDMAHGLVGPACEVLVEASKEKLVRMAVGFLKNMLVKANKTTAHEYATLMISHKVHNRVKAIVHQKQYTDEELLADAEMVEAELKLALDSLSSYDEYVAELKSGKLEWSPVHRSERFWRESVTKLNDNQYALLKILIAYLKQEEDSQSLSIAVHDLGEYVRHYPFGKRALDELGAKPLIMGHMGHPDSQVRYESLIAVQKLMTDQWEFLSQQTKKAAQGGQ